MKRLLKKSISFFIATVMVLSIVFFGAAQADGTEEMYTEVNIVKVGLGKKANIKDCTIGRKELGTLLDEKELSEMLSDCSDKNFWANEIERVSGAKFYVFTIDSYKTFKNMKDNPDKYDTVEKIKEQCNEEGELKGHVKYANTINEKDASCEHSTLSKDTSKEKLKNFGYTDEEGILKVVLKTQKNYFPQHYFWIVEDIRGGIGEATSVDLTYSSSPIGVALPMRDPNIESEKGEMYEWYGSLTTINDKAKYEKIYVYPKNLKRKTITKEKTVETEAAKYVSIDNYQNFDWFLHANIPDNYFENITYLCFEDTAEVEAPVAEGEKSEIEKDDPEKGNKNRGFVFNAKPEDVEVYVKKRRPYDYGEDYEKKVEIDKKYYNVKVQPGATNFKLEFKSNVNDINRKETVLDINNPDIYGKEHPIYGEDKFKKKDELTMFVKINARYSDINDNGDSTVSKEKKDYSTEKNFEEDVNDKSRGVKDEVINKYRANDFSLKFSREERFDSTSPKSEAEGNLYKPRVNTGAAKFFKYVEEREGVKGVDKAKFYVKRTSKVNVVEEEIEDFEDIEDIIHYFVKYPEEDEEYCKLMHGLNVGEKEEYLAIKDNKKIWIDSKKFEEAKKNNGEVDGAKLYSLESGENGLFELRGLEYSSYKPKFLEYAFADKIPVVFEKYEVERKYSVEEYMPPEGCILNRTHGINFAIDKGTQYKNAGEEVEGKISNANIIGNQKDVLTDEVLNQRRKIENIKAVIPGTGSRDALYFIIAGISVLLITYLLYRRKNKKIEKNK